MCLALNTGGSGYDSDWVTGLGYWQRGETLANVYQKEASWEEMQCDDHRQTENKTEKERER
jgi:hypothetical protein